MGGENLDRITTHTEGATREGLIVALVLLGHQVCQKLALVERVTNLHFKRHGGIGLDRADTIDAGNRCYDDHVIALQQRTGGGVAHAVDLLVYAGFFFDIGIRTRDIGFRLVIVIIGDKIFNRIIREEVFHLAI